MEILYNLLFFLKTFKYTEMLLSNLFTYGHPTLLLGRKCHEKKTNWLWTDILKATGIPSPHISLSWVFSIWTEDSTSLCSQIFIWLPFPSCNF